jgi:hypothetical protein
MHTAAAILTMLAALPCRFATAGTLLDRASLDGTSLAQSYAKEVRPRLTVPDAEQKAWALLLSTLLADKDLAPQYVVLVDRNPFIQAVTIYWMAPDRTFHFIGASPASTGKPGSFDHFITPTGIFEHTIANLDFRAEGTRNDNGILGYGHRGMRVYDFGWQEAERGWGIGGEATMRLQMHATDPKFLEIRLGTIQSKGCIRIPATLNTFIDRHAISTPITIRPWPVARRSGSYQKHGNQPLGPAAILSSSILRGPPAPHGRRSAGSDKLVPSAQRAATHISVS